MKRKKISGSAKPGPEISTGTLGDLKPDPKNARRHNPRNIGMISDAMQEVGAARSIVVDEDHIVRAGNGAVEAAAQAGIEKVKFVEADGNELVAVVRRGLTDEQKRRLALYDNRTGELSDWDPDVIASLRDENPEVLARIFSNDEIAAIAAGVNGNGDGTPPPDVKTLAERFVVPPFSVLDARQGYWQERKQAWLSLGIESEVGRKENLLKHNVALGMEKQSSSIFDPVLCELAYRWFCPESGVVLDPFAGGSVRGIVAARLGRSYIGLELRGEQIKANEAQAKAICRKKDRKPSWILGDSTQMDKHPETKRLQADFVFSCPPYFDLEVYSDDPKDLSNAASFDDFIAGYDRVIRLALDRLKANRFACFVVGDVRDRSKKGEGFYRQLPQKTAEIFERAGASLYNEAILVTAVGTLPKRVGVMFKGGRKLGPTHQHVLVFCKGDPRKAVASLSDAEFGDVEDGTFGEVL